MNSNDSHDPVLQQTIDDHILLVTLNRPTAANAFDTDMAWALIRLFEDLATRTPVHRVVILTGAGDRAFCAGGDLKERDGMTDEEWHSQHLVFERMIRAILGCPLPTIGAINGAAYGGGCELAAALDFILVAEHARFAQSEVRLGIIPGAGGTQTLARAIGQRRAMELILSGRSFSAREAQEWGLASRMCSAAELLEQTLDCAREIAANAPIAVRQAKRAIVTGSNMSLPDALAFELEAYNRTVSTQDRREGVRAFVEKRKPTFTGR